MDTAYVREVPPPPTIAVNKVGSFFCDCKNVFFVGFPLPSLSNFMALPPIPPSKLPTPEIRAYYKGVSATIVPR